ncbi:hypothetical protein GXW74_09890 [Roseomonas eburnea]|uniref:Uncharacterized protein n=1 Tax=Neoroseomonas eburnea TaxID=1346889 RepID=A0A9X9XAR2_9PROT|nr:hypothetical protein [Neoroseomonas eburnea]MBR0680798.1 hypothetical protein [Neoroseomonas eburnea]
MRRWVPFAVAIFMLTPFALWAGFSMAGLGGGLQNVMTSPDGLVLTLASLPLAGLFWIQNLRQIGDSIDTPSRLRSAERLTRSLPLAMLAIGVGGLAWMRSVGSDGTSLLLTAAGVLAMAGFGWLAARAPALPDGEASPMPASDPREGERSAEAFLWFVLNLVLVTGSLAVLWTPLVILWVAVGLVPVVFVTLMSVAAWGCRQA